MNSPSTSGKPSFKVLDIVGHSFIAQLGRTPALTILALMNQLDNLGHWDHAPATRNQQPPPPGLQTFEAQDCEGPSHIRQALAVKVPDLARFRQQE